MLYIKNTCKQRNKTQWKKKEKKAPFPVEFLSESGPEIHSLYSVPVAFSLALKQLQPVESIQLAYEINN